MLSLKNELVGAGLMTGPIDVATSHSDMERTRKALLGLPQFVGKEEFLTFGSDIHSSLLEKAKPKDVKVKAITKVVESNATFQDYMKDAICEVKVQGKLNGVPVNFILDIHQPHLRRGADLKTTSCSSEESFTEKAIEYGYFRQAATYMRCANLKNFLFIGIQKVSPHSLYFIDVRDFPTEMKYANEELNLLLHIFKNYGKLKL